MQRYTDEQYFEVCKLCISYLYDNYYNESGLFRSNVSQTEVRLLLNNIIESSNSIKLLDNPDPHLVAEVLQLSLKRLHYPLMYEVYQDMIETDLDDENFELTEAIIQKWIVKLPPVNFYLTASLYRLLSKLAELDENNTGLIQLSFILSPTICRPMNSAYMSIRHMEDLIKIRPVVSFIMENCDEIFTEDLKPIAKSNNVSTKDSSRHQIFGLNSILDSKTTDDITNLMSTSMNFDSILKTSISDVDNDFMTISSEGNNTSNSSGGYTGINHTNTGGSGINHTNLRSNLLVMVPTTTISPLNNNNNNNSDKDSLSHNLAVTIDNLEVNLYTLQQFSQAERDIFEAMVFSQVSNFFDFDDSVDGSFGDNNSEHSLPITNNHQTMKSNHHHSSSSNSSNHMNNIHGNNSSSSNSNSGVTVKSRRRKMVADCKAMRVQIFEFEQEWTKKYNRIPKSFERGTMESVYTRYRKLKKEIRDLAATDVQRLFRGYYYRLHHNVISMNKSNHKNINRANIHNNKMMTNNNNTTNNISNNYYPGSKIPLSLYTSYKDLLDQKRDLKRKLKKFDEDFYEKYKRDPKKSDKEVIRPLYQSYHEIKANLDRLRGIIETSHGPLPDDLQDNEGAQIVHNRNETKENSNNYNQPVTYSNNSLDFQHIIEFKDNTNSNNSNNNSNNSSNNSTNTIDYDSLQLEKRNLHAYLKVYERDFSRMHGRPVTKHSDIQPVAQEYHRYKELKALLRDTSKKNISDEPNVYK